jgi:hypothetical protein
MTKSEHPPLRLIVGTGKLTPADAYSEERLDSFRQGMEMFWQPVTDPQSKLRKKYWAILARVVKDCPSPWKDIDDASNELKRVLGIVRRGYQISGVEVSYPRSLNELEEPEFEAFFENAMAVLYRVTGVDPETLKKESSDPGDDQETDSPGRETSEGSGVGGGIPPTANAAVTDSSASPQADEGSGGTPPPPADSAAATPSTEAEALKAEVIRKLLQLAADKELTVSQRLETLDGLKSVWADQLPAELLAASFETVAKVIKGELQADAAKRYLASLRAEPKEKDDADPNA